MSTRGIDEAIAELFLSAVSPAKIEIALQALEEWEAQHQEARRQWDLQLERAEYDVELARRRYEAADPENRLVAAELEALWEQALQQRERLQQDRAAFERREAQALGEEEHRMIRDLSQDLQHVWSAPTTSMEERKTLLRLLVRRVHLDGVSEAGKIRIDVEWHTGAHSSLKVDRLAVGVWAPKTPAEALQRIHDLLAGHDYAAIAKTLNEEGFQSAKGLRFDERMVGYIARSRGWNAKAGKAERPRKGQSRTACLM